jgi:hypothetical protein
MARPPVFKVPEKQRIVLAVRAPVAAPAFATLHTCPDRSASDPYAWPASPYNRGARDASGGSAGRRAWMDA